jgi:hypothetical protein
MAMFRLGFFDVGAQLSHGLRCPHFVALARLVGVSERMRALCGIVSFQSQTVPKKSVSSSGRGHSPDF